jgi:stage II sporulation protein D
MKHLYPLLFLFCISAFADEESAAPAAYEQAVEPIQPRNILVLLEKDAAEVLLEVKGPYMLFNPHDQSRIASGLLGKRFMIREMENGLKWGEEFPGIHQLYIRPKSPDTAIFINGIQYGGSVAIYGVNGTVNIVNDLDIESYVKSVLSSQFTSPLESEVMSSLAILVRTDAYYNAIKNEQSFWHVGAQDAHYAGCALVVNGSSMEKAVDNTRHLILVHSTEEGKSLPFPTTWTENCAGKTAAYESMFRREVIAPEKGVEAPHAALSRTESKWSYQLSKKNLAAALDIPQIKSIEVFVDKPSGKVYGVRIQDNAETHDIDFFTLQTKLGLSHILSSDFTVALKEDAVLFSGVGRGHGVGLCLYSASALAQNGENAVKILSKFFPETYLLNLNAIPDGSKQ